jgi:sterol desaturase/sphingolipid hydroxylase (fatty acid hydroxylase superfamily)
MNNSSIKNFFFINGFLLLLSFCEFSVIKYYDEKHNQYNNMVNMMCVIFSIFIIRNYTLLQFIESGTRNKLVINKQSSLIPKEEYPYEFHVNVATATVVESITHVFIKQYIITGINSNAIYVEILWFIPMSFCFEVVFDFFHYIGHRLLHDNRVYKYFHKKHHKFQHPISITTFYQDPLDLFITNSIPTVFSLCILLKVFLLDLSYLQFHMMLVYKSFIEISGHSGKLSYPTSSYPQCIWIPRWLCMELYTEDHDLHHSLNNCNYAKRFSLWDKVFGTYKPYCKKFCK